MHGRGEVVAVVRDAAEDDEAGCVGGGRVESGVGRGVDAGAGQGRGERGGVVADDGPGGGGGVRGRCGEGCPLDAVQGVVVGDGGGREPVGGGRAHGQGLDGGDRGAGGVGEGEPDGAGARRGEGDPAPGRAAEGEGDPGEGERQVYAVAVLGGEEAGGVQGRVEERGVQGEPSGAVGGVVGQGDLGEDVVSVPPGGAQALEDGAVAVAVGVEALVEAGEVDGPGVRRGPGLGRCRGGGAGPREQAGGVQGPLVVRGVLGP